MEKGISHSRILHTISSTFVPLQDSFNCRINQLRSLRFLSFVVIHVLLINVIGVAQVSHFCLTAVMGSTSNCGQGCGTADDCCEKQKSESFDCFQESPCCMEVIKVHQNSVISSLTNHEKTNFAPAISPIFDLSTFVQVPPIDTNKNPDGTFFKEDYPGTGLLIAIRLLRI